MTGLERWGWLLLRAYPPQYRADRGAEILATVLESAPPDRTWPRGREAGSLLVQRTSLLVARVTFVFVLGGGGLKLPRPDQLSYAAVIAVMTLTSFVRMGVRRVMPI
jgi:hypothetical protein